jgi:hypothetical protein
MTHARIILSDSDDAVESALQLARRRRNPHEGFGKVPDDLIGAGKAPPEKLLGQHSFEARRLLAQRDRSPRAEGGAATADNPLDSLGDAISEGFGRLVGGGDHRATAQDQPASDAGPDFIERWSTNPLSQFLFSAGLGAMASDRVNPLQAIGEGTLNAYPVLAATRDYADAQAQKQADADFIKRLTTQTPMRPTPAPETEGDTPVTPTVGPSSDAETAKPTQTAPAKPATTPLDTIGQQMSGLQREASRLSTLSALATSPAQRHAVDARLADVRAQITALRQDRDRADRLAYQQRGSIGVVGVDRFGQPQRGWVSGPKAGQPLSQDEKRQAGDPNAAELHGEDFLMSLPSDMRDTVRGIAEGRLDMPRKNALQMQNAVMAYDPSFRSDRRMVWKQYESQKATDPGGQILSGNVVLNHLGELSDRAQELHASNYPLWNKVAQGAQEAIVGFPALSQFNDIKGHYAEELARFYRGAGGTEADIKRALDNMDAAKTPAALNAVIEQEMRLIAGKVDALEGNWRHNMGEDAEVPIPDFKVKRAKALDAIERINQRAGKKEEGRTNPAPQVKHGDEITRYGATYRWDDAAKEYKLVKKEAAQ